jgi:signal transduction histidine kinase
VSVEGNCQFSLPVFCEGSYQDLRLESNLGELPLFYFEVQLSLNCADILPLFEKYPLLPGVVLRDSDRFFGMISRQRLLEFLIRPRGMELFLNSPLEVIYSYARTDLLLLHETMPIVEVARLALRRSPELLGEPIVVEMKSGKYKLLNIHELNIAYWQIRGIETQLRFERVQAQMIQSEKMASLGRLVDGVAHEILDPVGFIWGNLTYIDNYSTALIEIIEAYEAHIGEPVPEIEALKVDLEFEFLKEDLPHSLDSIKNGAQRLKTLATSLQNFCHIDEVFPKPADLHSCIDSVLLLLQSRLSGEIEVVKNYGHLPPIHCYASQLSQVFMNILSNAIDALLNQAIDREFTSKFQGSQKLSQSARKSRIEITTQLGSPDENESQQPQPRWVTIQIADNGPGMSPEILEATVESFSVQRRAQKETSLAVSYWIVTARHGGRFRLRSQLGEGTEFEILLPAF